MPDVEGIEQLLQELNYSLNAISFSRIFWAIVILFAGYWLARFIRYRVGRRLGRSDLTEQVVGLIKALIHATILLTSIVIALTILNVPSSFIIAVMVMVWVLLLLILQPSLGSISAGMFFHIYKPFTAGHLVETAGKIGYVEEMGLNYSVLRMLDNKIVTIPNDQIRTGGIVNYSRPSVLRADMEFYISYQDSLPQARQILTEIIANDPRILKGPPPRILVLALDNRGVKLGVWPYVKGEDYLEVLWDTPERVKLAFDEAGITIPVLQHNVHLIPGMEV